MPAYNFRLDTSNQVVADIMKNFLFTDSTSTNPAPTNAALIDLTKLYKADTSTPHSIDLFNPKST
jgi:hypothetical protein